MDEKNKRKMIYRKGEAKEAVNEGKRKLWGAEEKKGSTVPYGKDDEGTRQDERKREERKKRAT